jgi:hypothetical protein
MRSALNRPLGPNGTLLTIDPGTTATGIAIFTALGELCRAWLVPDPYCMAQRVSSDEMLIEIPRAYGAGSPVDPNDLIKLALLGGYLAGINNSARRWYIHPQDWKGQVPKKIDNERTLRQLKDNERHILGERPNHNVVDAVGIGLWALGRRR